MAGTASNLDGEHDVDLYALGGGTNPVFRTSLATPGLAGAAAILNGLAYVADGTAGLQVLNYVAADTAGRPPEVRPSPPPCG